MRTPFPSFCAADPVLSTVPVQLFDELTAELAGLAEAIMRTALHVKINAVIADAVEVDRTAEALRAAAGRATETIEQAKLKLNSSATARDAQAFEMAETASFLLPPQQDNCAGNASRGEIELIDELNEAAFADPKVPNFREDNAIAARVLELRDRLGGFINPT